MGSGIHIAVNAEFTSIKTEAIARYLKDWAKVGVMKWK
jgi:hypothetical protein